MKYLQFLGFVKKMQTLQTRIENQTILLQHKDCLKNHRTQQPDIYLIKGSES